MTLPRSSEHTRAARENPRAGAERLDKHKELRAGSRFSQILEHMRAACEDSRAGAKRLDKHQRAQSGLAIEEHKQRPQTRHGHAQPTPSHPHTRQ